MEFITLSNKGSVRLIKDVILYPLKINSDESGVLVETLRSDWPVIYSKDRKFAMQYYSITPSGVARDENTWHYHPTIQEDRFIVVSGAIVVAIADNRKKSPTVGLLNLFYMQAKKDPYILLVPAKTLHGFLVVSSKEAIILNYPTALYNSKEEGRLSFNKENIKFSNGQLFTWQKVRDGIRKKTIK